MTTNKTQFETLDPTVYLISLDLSPQKRQDCKTLMEIMEEATGYAPKMYGNSIIGFGKYRYQYASGHQGEAPLVAFSPRKNAFSLYVTMGNAEEEAYISALGTFKRGKACIYAKELKNMDLGALKILIKRTIRYIQQHYEIY